MGMVGEACFPSKAYYPRTPDYTFYSWVHVCWSEHSDSSFVYGFMSLDYGLGSLTATTQPTSCNSYQSWLGYKLSIQSAAQYLCYIMSFYNEVCSKEYSIYFQFKVHEIWMYTYPFPRWINWDATPTLNLQPVRLLDKLVDKNSYTQWQTVQTEIWRSQLIWVYTVCKDRANPGS